MTEVKKQEARPAKTKVKVKNITKRSLFLANGEIEAGKQGIATSAELITQGKYLEEVKA